MTDTTRPEGLQERIRNLKLEGRTDGPGFEFYKVPRMMMEDIVRELEGRKEQPNYEHLYNQVMSLLRQTKEVHGLCQRKACRHCNAADEINKLTAEYRGARVTASREAAFVVRVRTSEDTRI